MDCFRVFSNRHKPTKGLVLVTGNRVYENSSDRRELYEDAVGTDMQDGPGVDFVHNLEEPLPFERSGYSHIDSHSLLEHCERPWKVAENLEGALLKGGSILVSAPFVWRVHGYPSDFWRFSKHALEVLFPNIEWKELVYFTDEEFVDRPPSKRMGKEVWFRRTEVGGFGIKR